MIRLPAVLTLSLLALTATAADLPRAVWNSDYRTLNPGLVTVGQQLFYDPILSGNRNISCATCHHPRFGTSDGQALGLGEGGIGLGPDRMVDPDNVPEQHIPRNALSLFNLGAREFTVMFFDGRIEADPSRPSGLRTPLDEDMVQGFSGVLSAQTMFPVLSPDEMAGHYDENEISTAVRQGRLTGSGGAWDLIAARVRAIPEYQTAFKEALPEVAAGRQIAFTDISNAIADFIAAEWRTDNSPFDAHLRGEAKLTGAALRGMDLFYGAAGCADCHSGPFQTNHSFHAMGEPQFGPGKAARFERHTRDLGRGRVTGDPIDSYAFRTPSLRNVSLTAPYGHTGAFPDLKSFIAHHLDPIEGLVSYDPSITELIPLEGKTPFEPLKDEAERAAISAAVTRAPLVLNDTDMSDLLAFLFSLTDEVAVIGRMGIPDRVPSGLPVER